MELDGRARRSSRASSTKDATIEFDKQAAGHVEVVDNTERMLLDRYPLLKDLSQEELDKLNKTVVRKLDWVFLPCVTLMLLMKYDSASPLDWT